MSMEGIASPVIHFPGVEIDVSRECVRAAGVEHQLRHKTFEVLLYLIENRGRVVSKSELFDSIWNGVAVTEDTLVQSIVEIRKAVGDDPRVPQFIRTVPRVGYEIIAPVAPPSAPVAPTEPPIAIATPRDRRPLFAILGILLVVAAIAGTLFLRRKPESDPQPATATPSRTQVAVAFFESRTTTPDLEWLRDGLPTMVLTYLSREPNLTLISRDVMDRSRKSGAAPIEIARRAGAQRLIRGTFERSGPSVRIDAQLYDVATGRLLGGSSVVTTRDSLLNDVDVLSSRLAVLLGSRATQVVPLHQTDRMTDSLDAYEAYCRGVAEADGLNNVEAVKQFEQAIALDPDFAMAHARIGYVYSVTSASPDRALPYFAKALALSNRLSDRERLYVLGWQAIAQHDFARAIDHFRLLISRYPTDLEAYARLGRLLTGEERLTEAIDVLGRGRMVDPDAPELNNAIGIAESYLGRHADAIAHHQRYVAAIPNEPNAHDSLGLSYQWAGEYERALAAYNEALRLNPRFEVAVVHRANTYWQMGRNALAIRELQRYITMAPADVERARGYCELVTVYRGLGMLEQEAESAREVALHHPDHVIQDVLVAVDRRDLPTVARLAETVRMLGSGRGMRNSIRIPCHARAEAARALGDADRAIESAREALRHVPPVYLADDLEDVLGDTLAAFGRHREAIDEYRRILTNNANRGRTRYKLARSLEHLGQTTEARKEYEQFLRVWSTADRDAPEVIAAQARVRALAAV